MSYQVKYPYAKEAALAEILRNDDISFPSVYTALWKAIHRDEPDILANETVVVSEFIKHGYATQGIIVCHAMLEHPVEAIGVCSYLKIQGSEEPTLSYKVMLHVLSHRTIQQITKSTSLYKSHVYEDDMNASEWLGFFVNRIIDQPPFWLKEHPNIVEMLTNAIEEYCPIELHNVIWIYDAVNIDHTSPRHINYHGTHSPYVEDSRFWLLPTKDNPTKRDTYAISILKDVRQRAKDSTSAKEIAELLMIRSMQTDIVLAYIDPLLFYIFNFAKYFLPPDFESLSPQRLMALCREKMPRIDMLPMMYANRPKIEYELPKLHDSKRKRFLDESIQKMNAAPSPRAIETPIRPFTQSSPLVCPGAPLRPKRKKTQLKRRKTKTVRTLDMDPPDSPEYSPPTPLSSPHRDVPDIRDL